MRIPKGNLVKTYQTKSEYTTVIKQLTADGFNGYLLVNTPIDGIDAKGYLVFEAGLPIFAYYEHKDVLNDEHVMKMGAANFTDHDAIMELHELSIHQIDICKTYISCINDSGAKVNELNVNEGIESISPIDDPEHQTTENKSVVPDDMDLIDAKSEDEIEAYLRESVNTFKEQSGMMLESIGLSHMIKEE